MVIAFSAFFYRTEVFLEISKRLSKNGIDVVWYSSDPNITKYLLIHNIKNEDILKLHEWKKTKIKVAGSLNKIDAIEGFEINKMIINDRLLSRYSPKFTDFYLGKVSAMIEQYIEKKSINLVVGEPTPVVEQIVAALCKKRNIKYIQPMVTRIPNKRFFFFEPYDHYNPAIKNTKKNSDNLIKITKPDYWVMKKHRKPRLISITKLFKIIKNEFLLGNIDPTRPRAFYLLNSKIKHAVNSSFFNFIPTTKFNDLEKNKKYVLYTLHKQPEASIDVMAPLINDQAFLINTISKLIPYGYTLLVKPNQNGLGDFSFSFYKKITSHNTLIVDPLTDSRDLINISDITFSITGTSAYEAGLMSKKAITFKKMFFNRLNGVEYCENINALRKLIVSQINNKPGTGMNVKDFSTFMYSSSFEGDYNDCNSNPDALKVNNIKKLTNAFMELIDNYSS